MIKHFRSVCNSFFNSESTIIVLHSTCRYQPPLSLSKVCIDKLEDVDKIISGCAYDFCSGAAPADFAVCTAAEIVAKQCLEDHHISVDWRSNNFCRKLMIPSWKWNMKYVPIIRHCDLF